MKSTNVNLNWMSGFLIRKNAHRQMKRKFGDCESFIMREPLSRRFVDWGLQQYCSGTLPSNWNCENSVNDVIWLTKAERFFLLYDVLGFHRRIVINHAAV